MKYLLDFKLFEAESKEENLSNEEIVDKASKYKTLSELRRKDSKLYWLVVQKKLINSVFPRKSKWTKEELEKESEKYNSRGEFGRKSPGAYNRAMGLGILDELFPKF